MLVPTPAFTTSRTVIPVEEIIPLIIFTTCGGIAAGAYGASALAGLCGEPADGKESGGAVARANREWLFPLVCIVLLGLGLLATLAHLGQPMRFVNGMANPASMISQESYWAIGFGIVMVIDLVLAKVKGVAVAPVRWIGALVGFGLMVVTGLAYYDCTFLPAWATAVTVPLFVVGDLLMGAGLALVFAKANELRPLCDFCVMGAVAWLGVTAGYAVYLMGLGFDAALVFGSMVLAIAAAAVAMVAMKGKLAGKTAAIALLVLTVLAVVLARWAFFAAGVL